MVSSESRFHDYTNLYTSHFVGPLWTSDQPNAETSTWQHATLKRESQPLPRVEFEPAIPKNERQQTVALNRAATGIGWLLLRVHLSVNDNTLLTLGVSFSLPSIWKFPPRHYLVGCASIQYPRCHSNNSELIPCFYGYGNEGVEAVSRQRISLYNRNVFLHFPGKQKPLLAAFHS